MNNLFLVIVNVGRKSSLILYPVLIFIHFIGITIAASLKGRNRGFVSKLYDKSL